MYNRVLTGDIIHILIKNCTFMKAFHFRNSYAKSVTKIMVTTSQILPNPLLSPYVAGYILREFDTCGIDSKRPWIASYYTSITFFFKAKPINLRDPVTGNIIKTGDCISILGLSSEYNGEMTFNGSYSFLELAFKPTGLNEIFGIDVAEIKNQIIDAKELLDSDIQILYEHLCESKELKEMALLADVYLMGYLLKKRQVCTNNGILKLVGNVMNNYGKGNLDLLTSQSNMSHRNLERLFLNKVGVSPKHLICIIRFNFALTSKKQNPSLNWTSIAAESGYFDQMHMIREFKHFSGNTPCHLINIPLVNETNAPSHFLN